MSEQSVCVLLFAGRAGNDPAWINAPLLHCSYQVLIKGTVIFKTSFIPFPQDIEDSGISLHAPAPSQEKASLAVCWDTAGTGTLPRDSGLGRGSAPSHKPGPTKVWTLCWLGEVSISQLKAAPLYSRSDPSLFSHFSPSTAAPPSLMCSTLTSISPIKPWAGAWSALGGGSRTDPHL